MDKEYIDLLEQQRRAFEAQFGSLQELGYKDEVEQAAKNESGSASGSSDGSSDDSDNSDDSNSESDSDAGSESGSGSESEFAGFSDSEDAEWGVKKSTQSTAQVVTFLSKTVPETAEGAKAQSKSKSKNKNKNKRKGKVEFSHKEELAEKIKELEFESELLNKSTSKEDMENMQKDLELQRLLKESHILATSTQVSGAELTMQTLDSDPFGKTRAKTMQQRIRSLQDGDSRKLAKMPMNMRKGMLRKEIDKVAKFEQAAKDSGTILAKTGKYELRDINIGRANKVMSKSDLIGTTKISKKKLQEKKSFRERGLQIQSIGKSTRNGLVVSEREYASMGGRVLKNGKMKGFRKRK